MTGKRYAPEQIIAMLREAEVRLSQGEKVGAISRSLGISERRLVGRSSHPSRCYLKVHPCRFGNPRSNFRAAALSRRF